MDYVLQAHKEQRGCCYRQLELGQSTRLLLLQLLLLLLLQGHLQLQIDLLLLLLLLLLLIVGYLLGLSLLLQRCDLLGAQPVH
jgi:hypothetical protein